MTAEVADQKFASSTEVKEVTTMPARKACQKKAATKKKMVMLRMAVEAAQPLLLLKRPQ